MATLLYLYVFTDYGISKVNNSKIVFSDSNSISGINYDVCSAKEIIELENHFKLKQFEVQQKDFRRIISESSDLGIMIDEIKFKYPIDEDDIDLVREYCLKKDFSNLLDFVSYQADEMENEIEEINFTFSSMIEGRIIKMRFNDIGRLFINSNRCNLPALLDLHPIQILCGLS